MGVIHSAMAGAAAGAAERRRLNDKLQEAFTKPEDFKDASQIVNLILAENHPIVAIIALVMGFSAAFIGAMLGDAIAGNTGAIIGCFLGVIAVFGITFIINGLIAKSARKKLQQFVYKKSRISMEKKVREILKELNC